MPLKFLTVGIANTLTGLAAIYLCRWLFRFDDVLANIAGYIFGLTVSFLLNRSWTFQSSSAVMPAALRFLAVFAIAYPTNLIVVLIAIRVFGVNPYVAQALGIPPYTALFYLGSRYFAFNSGAPPMGTLPGNAREQ